MNRSEMGRVHQAARTMAPGLTRLSTATAPMATRGFQNPDTMRGAPTQRRADDNDQRPDPGDDDDQVFRPGDDEDDDTNPADTLDEPTRPDNDNTGDDDRDDQDNDAKKNKRARWW